MKDFDGERLKQAEGRDTEFKVGGETFHARLFVSPEALAKYDFPGTGMEDVAKGFDEFVTAMIVPADAKKWAKVRKDADPPLSLANIEAIASWLIDQATGRPTKASSASTPGRDSSPATLTAA